MLKGWRTVVFNGIMLIAMIGTQSGWWTSEEAPTGESVNVFLDNLDGVLTFVWGLGNIGLRMVTNTPVGKSK